MTLEVRIPISPGPSWYNKVRLIVASIREFYEDSIFRVSVTWEPLQQFYPEIAGVTWNEMSLADFVRWQGTRSEYIETVLDKFKPPFRGDYILSLDADVICCDAFNSLFIQNERISGVMAHVPPISAMNWRRLMMEFGVYNFSLDKQYSGYGVMTNERFGPTYFNSGVVFGPRHIFEQLYEPYFDAIRFLRRTFADTYWFDQLGLALGIAKAGIEANILPLRYNFPNQKEFDERFPSELRDVRFLHYLRTDIIDRDRDLMSKDVMERLIARVDLIGSNEIFRKRVEQLMPRLP